MRPLLVIAGTFVLALAWLGLLAQGGGQGFTGHMLVHVAVVAIAAPLLAAGLAGSRLETTSTPSWIFEDNDLVTWEDAEWQ